MSQLQSEVGDIPKPKLKEEDDEFETRDFVELESDFQAVLKEIGGDKQLEHFRVEYEKLHRALKLSHDNEKKLIKKCKDLNTEITESTLKVQQALRLSEEESNNIKAFKADLDRALRTIESFKEKEEKAKQTITSLRDQIASLGTMVEQSSGLAVGQDSTVNELLRTKDELMKEVNIANEQISSAQLQNTELIQAIKNLESQKQQHQSEINNLKEVIGSSNQKLEDENKEKNKLENYLDEEKKLFESARSKIEKKDQNYLKYQGQMQEVEKNIKLAEADSKEHDYRVKSNLKELQDLNRNINNIQEDYNKVLQETEKIKDEIQRANNDCAAEEQKQRDLKRQLNIEVKRGGQLVEEKRRTENLREEARRCVDELNKESNVLKRNTEIDKKTIENLKRERDIVMKTVFKARENVRVQEDQIVTQQNNAKKIKNEISGYSKENQRMTQLVWQLQAEKERYGIEKSQAYAKYRQCLEEVKLCNSVIAELQKKSVELESKLKQQQGLFDSVRADRNLFSKNVMESHQEIAELERRRNIMKQEVDKLGDDISLKNAELLKENQRNSELEGKKNELFESKRKLEKKARKLEQIINESKAEIQDLKYVIQEVEDEKIKQKKELELVTNERDILSTQLIRRKEELDLLYEKINIYSSTLNKGERQYKERLCDIQILKQRIADLKDTLNQVKKRAATVFDLKKEKYRLDREVLDEKVKVKALSEEVENTMNVHRWRKLEGTEPETYELITKVHTLQRRLIGKSEEVIKKNAELEALELEYNKLKTKLSRHPGPESGEQLELCRKTMEEKRKQMTNMEQELNIIRAQESEYTYEIDRLNKELQGVKHSFFDLKKKERLKRERIERIEGRDKLQIMRHPPPQRYMGGGFNLAI